MSQGSRIEWTQATWNPVAGCTPVSPGCLNCYAARMALRLGRMGGATGRKYEKTAKRAPGGRPVFTGHISLDEDALDLPRSWRLGRLIFVNSMSDLFHELVPDEFIDQVFAVMAMAPQHTFQVLTKRPERMAAYFAEKWQPAVAMGATEGEDRSDHVWYAMQNHALHLSDRAVAHLFDKDDNYIRFPWPLPNVWLGTSTEDQKTADERVPHLLNTPAAVRFLSCEPLLGPITLGQWQPEGVYIDWLRGFDGSEPAIPGLDWIIAGGESGPDARPMHPDWARGLRDQCVAAGVPYFMKQWGEWRQHDEPDATHIVRRDGSFYERSSFARTATADMLSDLSGLGLVRIKRVGNKAAGRLLDGREWNEFPKEDARVSAL